MIRSSDVSLFDDADVLKSALRNDFLSFVAKCFVYRTHPTKTPGRCDLPLMVAQAAAALFCGWFAFQFQGSRSAILLAG